MTLAARWRSRTLATTVIAMLILMPYRTSAAVQEAAISPCVLDSEGTVEAASSTDAQLDGRIGGSPASFEERFGESREPTDEEGMYQIVGCGWNTVDFFDDAFAISMILVPEGRPLDLTFNERHESDWSPSDAEQIVAGFIPSDATERRSTTVNAGYTFSSTEYYSESLKRIVPPAAWDYADHTPKYGAIEILMWRSTGNKVTTIQIDLQIEDSDYQT